MNVTTMKLIEIFDFNAAQRNVNLMKQNAQRQVKLAKDAQARLNIKKQQQKLLQAQKPMITLTP